MTCPRLPQHPAGYTAPLDLPILELRAVVAAMRRHRYRCEFCGGQVALEPPSLLPGRLYCRSCGRTWNDVVDRLRPPYVPEDEPAPRRGRPPKAPSKPVEPRPQCADCQHRPARTSSPRCWGCASARGAAARAARAERIRRLVSILETGPRLGKQLAIELDIALDNVRYVVRDARGAGYPITTHGHLWRLEEVAS